MQKLVGGIFALGCMLCASLGFRPAQAQTQDLISGVNAAIASMTVEQQNAILAQLHAAGVRYIRAGIPEDKGVDFARRALAQGIRINWLIQLQYRPGAPERPYPNAFGTWGGPPLSAADPEEFRKYFEPLLAKLDAAGVPLVGLELGAEINSPMDNADFAMPAENPGHSREFDLADLSQLGALAFTEVTGGANYDAADPRFGVRTFAIRDGDEWVINGEKHYTTNGTGWDGRGCHLYAVVCRTDPSKSAKESLAVIMVPGSAPGIQVTGILDTAGHRATISPRMKFENVRVPAGNIIGKPGDGITIVSTNFAWTAALIGAACVGVMRAAFDHALDFARKDARSGPHPIIEYATVGYMLADMKMKIEACRYLTWKSCQQYDLSGGKEQELAVMTKVFCSETCVDVVYDCMRLVGVDSYTDMHPLAELMNDAMCFPLYDGGNMGARRRQLHSIIKDPAYDPHFAPYGRFGARQSVVA